MLKLIADVLSTVIGLNCLHLSSVLGFDETSISFEHPESLVIVFNETYFVPSGTVLNKSHEVSIPSIRCNSHRIANVRVNPNSILFHFFENGNLPKTLQLWSFHEVIFGSNVQHVHANPPQIMFIALLRVFLVLPLSCNGYLRIWKGSIEHVSVPLWAKRAYEDWWPSLSSCRTSRWNPSA